MPNNRPEELTAEVKRLQDTLDTYSEELLDFMSKQADKSCLNWLVTYGVPETPHDVWGMFYALMRTVPALLLQEGYVTLEPKATAPADEMAERKAERANVQQSLFGTGEGLKALGDRIFGPSNGAGGYI